MQDAILRTEKPGQPPAWTKMMAQIQQVREVKLIIITAMRVPLELIVVVSDGSHPSLCSEIALSAKSAKWLLHRMN